MNLHRKIILFVSIFIAMLGFGIALTVLPFFIDVLGGGGRQFGVLISLYGLSQLIFAPIWGKISDKYGRKPIMLVGMFGFAAAMLLFGLASKVWMLYLAQAASGLLSSALPPVAMAYMGDSSTEDNRSGAMGSIGAAAGLGVIIGPGLAGLMAEISLTAPFFFAASLGLLTCLIIFALLPESLPREKRLSQMAKIHILDLKILWQALSTPIAFTLVIAFMMNFGKSNFTGAYAFYAQGRFNYGTEEVGIVLMVAGLMYALAQGLLVGPLAKKMGERKLISLSLLGAAMGFLLMLTSYNLMTMLLTVGFFNLFGALLKPTVLSLISRQALVNQGAAMGIAESYLSLGRMFGPLWAGYMLELNIFLPYLTGAILFLALFLASLTKAHRQTRTVS